MAGMRRDLRRRPDGGEEKIARRRVPTTCKPCSPDGLNLPLISLCSAFHAFHSAMKQMEPDSKAPGSGGSDSAKSPRSSEATVKGPDRVEDDEEQQKPAP